MILLPIVSSHAPLDAREAASLQNSRVFQQPVRLQNAAFVVQAFGSPVESFEEFARLCGAMKIKSERGQMNMTAVGDVRLGIGWADCPFATDADVASVA